MAELPEIGKHCEICKRLDFLPVECTLCRGIFCRNHLAYDQHKCPNPPSLDGDIAHKASTVVPFKKCDMKDCDEKLHSPIQCTGCEKNFCVAHRHPPDHQCSQYAKEQEEKLNKAKPKVVIAPRQKGQGKKSLALEAKVQLMRMKGFAVGDKTIPPENKLYFLVNLPTGAKNEPKAVFLNSQWSVGRSIDFMCNLYNVENMNNVAGEKKIAAFDINHDCLEFSRILSTIVDEGLLLNGGHLILDFMS